MKINDPIEDRIQEIIKSDVTLSREMFDYSPSYEGWKNIAFDISLTNDARNLLKRAWETLELTVQQLNTIEKIALAIARLDNQEICDCEHIAEAIQYRPLRTQTSNNMRKQKLC